MSELLELLDDHDDLLAKLDALECELDEGGVLVAVANNEGAGLVLKGHAGEELRLAPDLKPEGIRAPSLEDFLHHLAELVDLDREDAAVSPTVAILGNGGAKGLVEGDDAVAEDVLEADEERVLEVACSGLLDHVHDVHLDAVLGRLGHDVSLGVDIEVPSPPAVHVVQGSGGSDVPRWLRCGHGHGRGRRHGRGGRDLGFAHFSENTRAAL